MLPPDLADHFAAGLDHFNAGRYFDCHEEWEHVWLALECDEKRYLQALIQFAVALYHYERGNFSGARSLLERSCRTLESMPSGLFGVDTGTVLNNAELWHAAAEERGPEPAARPQIKLRIDAPSS